MGTWWAEALGDGVGWGPGLVHIHNQGCHVVRMLDAEGDNGGAVLGHCHLGEERLWEEPPCPHPQALPFWADGGIVVPPESQPERTSQRPCCQVGAKSR